VLEEESPGYTVPVSARVVRKLRTTVTSYFRKRQRDRKVGALVRGRARWSPGVRTPLPLFASLDYCARLAADRASGRYRYAVSSGVPILYASVYAALLSHLLGASAAVPERCKREWAEYIAGFQSIDGLYRDPAVANGIAETEDWWGWRHLSAHVPGALVALGSGTARPFSVLSPLYQRGAVTKWLNTLNWTLRRADYSSNAVMNVGVMLQYDRDCHSVEGADEALEELFAWLDEHQDPRTGLWGSDPFDTPQALSRGVQTAYHHWLVYFYARRRIRFIERCIDSCLKTQNVLGGFGVAANSSACEDIDSIDPLCRFYFMSEYRRADVVAALARAIPWVLTNQNEDGGFVFKRCEAFVYGHPLMSSSADESAAFPTWFRTLSLAYIAQVLPDHPVFRDVHFQFLGCPGYQFWSGEVVQASTAATGGG